MFFPAPAVVTNTCPAGQSSVPGLVSALPTVAMVGSAAAAQTGVTILFFNDPACTSPQGPEGSPYVAYGGFCTGGVSVTGCNAALGWATLNFYSSNSCGGILAPVAATLSTTSCTAVPGVWGMTQYLKLASADCSVPATAPTQIIQFKDPNCAYAEYPGVGPGSNWAVVDFLNPMTCNTNTWPVGDGIQMWNTTSMAKASDGSWNIIVYGANDLTCKGPVYSTYVGLTVQAGDTWTSGKCTAATTGNREIKVRLVAAPADTFGKPNGPVANTGVVLNFFNDSTCRFPNGGWADAAHTLSNSQYPTWAGYCMGGITATGGNAALGWASTAWFVGNDCDGMPTSAVTFVQGACTTVTNFGFTSYIRASSFDVAPPSQPPLEYLSYFEPTCTYEPYETLGPLGFVTTINPAASSGCFEGNIFNGGRSNNSKNVYDPVARTFSMYVYGDDTTDPHCTGAVYSSWVNLPWQGNTQYAGSCTAPTTGASLYNK